MCVPNSSPAKSVQEFIAYCNENRGKVTYASSGNGTTLHLSGELFKRLAKVVMTHIPYRRGGPGEYPPDSPPRLCSLRALALDPVACEGRQPLRALRDHPRA